MAYPAKNSNKYCERINKNKAQRTNLPGQLGETPDSMPHPLRQHMDEKEQEAESRISSFQALRKKEAKKNLKAKIETASSVATGDAVQSSDKVLGTAVVASGKGHVVSCSTRTASELRNPFAIAANKTIGASSEQPFSKTMLQNEQEIKQERRKQSIRESVRRSRLQKKAETDELARRVESLTTENLALKSEVVQLKLEKLGLENAALMWELKATRLGIPRNDCDDEKRMAAVSTENLLSGAANNSAFIVEEGEATM